MKRRKTEPEKLAGNADGHRLRRVAIERHGERWYVERERDETGERLGCYDLEEAFATIRSAYLPDGRPRSSRPGTDRREELLEEDRGFLKRLGARLAEGMKPETCARVVGEYLLGVRLACDRATQFEVEAKVNTRNT